MSNDHPITELKNAILGILSSGVKINGGQFLIFDSEQRCINLLTFLTVPQLEVKFLEVSTVSSDHIKKLLSYIGWLRERAGSWHYTLPLLVADLFAAGGSTGLHTVLELTDGGCCFAILESQVVHLTHQMQEDNLSLILTLGINNLLHTISVTRLKNEVEAYQKELMRYKQVLVEDHAGVYVEIFAETPATIFTEFGPAMQKVSKLISQVAYANSTVLILGETGTGKELIAKAIHLSSARKAEIMVKINCATLPSHLIESELFGHERGSFTGAVSRHIGKFELAENGTLFLDEIGELPPKLQVKLLRAIQEREIERVGGKVPIKINVRIIAATNRDLNLEVNEGRFRSDLYYRLNVFPIAVPSLRERKEDISKLTQQFIKKFARASGKKVNSISSKAMRQLMSYDWPGNVRELEHLIERTVLLNDGMIIKKFDMPKSERKANAYGENAIFKTMEEQEREHILHALAKANGKIYGNGGAAELLGMNFNTLNSRIKKLNIKKAVLVNVYSGSPRR